MNLKKIWPVIFLSALLLSVMISNFTPNTWLTGWDNLHPEFNFWLNIKRSIFAVWQEYQGLGLLGGMGHAADLVRQLFLAFVSIVVPDSLLRYFYHFLMLAVGVFGIYKLLDRCILDKFKIITRQKAAVLGSVFYLFNLGTIQYFYVPFEPYSHFWGFLPWLVFVLLRYLRAPTRKNLLYFALVNLLATPMAYVQTIFLVYFIFLAVFLLFYLLKERSKKSLKHSVGLGLIVLVINAFWLLPSLYFIKANFSVHRNAWQNQMATDKFYLMNKKRGTIKDFVFLKEFYYDYLDHVKQEDGFSFMMSDWRVHFSLKSVMGVGLVFFGMIILGLFTQKKYRLEITLLFILCATAFLSDTYGFVHLNGLLRKLPLLDQLFRNPFTKFIVPTILIMAVLFAQGLAFILDKLEKTKLKIATIALFLLILAGFSYNYYPVFKGSLISSNMRIDIPQEYMDLFAYLGEQEEIGRIANFPQTNIWGWEYYKWGYRGSGFLWYGLKQPVLDRAFDVWSNANENYYWEISQALYSKDLSKLESVLEKYQINWVLIDENMFSYTDYKSLMFNELAVILESSGMVKTSKAFGKLKLYHIDPRTPERDFVFLAGNLDIINSYRWDNNDLAFRDYGHYISDSKDTNGYDIYYPFRSLFTGRDQDELNFETYEENEKLVIISPEIENIGDYNLLLPELSRVEKTYWSEQLDEWQIATPEARIRNSRLELRTDKEIGYLSYNSDVSQDIRGAPIISCDPLNTGFMDRVNWFEDGQSLLRFISHSSSNCIAINLPHLVHNKGYLVRVVSRNVEGRSMLFHVENNTLKNWVLDTRLPSADKNTDIFTSDYVIPPQSSDGIGYMLIFDNISIGRQLTINDLGRIEVYPIPYNYLKEIKLVASDYTPKETKYVDINNFTVSHPNPSYYRVDIRDEQAVGEDTVLVLSQSYHSGWIAWQGMPVFGKRLAHVKVNNWANGWKLPENSQINVSEPNNSKLFNSGSTELTTGKTLYIIFWPQVLEYIGFGLLGGLAIYLWLKRK